MRNNVVNPASTSIGLVNWSKECAREMNPEVQATEVVVWPGALRKCTIEKMPELNRVADNGRLLRSKTPKNNPRKSDSSMNGTTAAVGATAATAFHATSVRIV